MKALVPLAIAGGAMAGKAILGKPAMTAVPVGNEQAILESSSMAIAVADKKARRLVARNAREERIYALLADPAVIGALVALGGMTMAQAMPWPGADGEQKALRNIASTAALLIGLGRAGVGEIPSALLAIGMLVGMSPSPTISWPSIGNGTIQWSDILAGIHPLGGLHYIIKGLS